MPGTRTLRRVALFTLLAACGCSRDAPGNDPLEYDVHADPFAQLAAAKQDAAASGKLILLVAGGQWCIWCHRIEAFIRAHPDIDRGLHEIFVITHVYYGEDNENEAFFATLPEAYGYPQFWVLDAAGKVLHSQNTALLEDGDKGYRVDRFMAFIQRWRNRDIAD